MFKVKYINNGRFFILFCLERISWFVYLVKMYYHNIWTVWKYQRRNQKPSIEEGHRQYNRPEKKDKRTSNDL